jgi:hypothetical protein
MYGQVADYTCGVLAVIPFKIFRVLFDNVQIKVCVTAMLPAFRVGVGLPILAVR